MFMKLIIKSNVKKATELAVSDEFLTEFEKQVEEILNKAVERARGNFRRTLFARDL
jgi:histone H3/H4